MALTKTKIQQLVAVITARYTIGDFISVEEFDKLLHSMGIIPDLGDESQRGTPEWASRVYIRNQARLKFNGSGFEWSPPVALVVHEHASQANGLGSLQLVDENMDTLAFAKRRANGGVTYFKSYQKEIERRQRTFGDEMTPAVARLLDQALTVAKMQQMGAENAQVMIEQAINHAETLMVSATPALTPPTE